jgi:hypothetical protein
MIGKCSNCDNQGSPFGKVHEEFEDRPVDELLCVFCGDKATEEAVKL